MAGRFVNKLVRGTENLKIRKSIKILSTYQREDFATMSPSHPDQDKVILHQLSPVRAMPSRSPPCFKLENYLRMAKIPYKNAYGFSQSSKGKLPWIEYKGTQVADSNFCIEFLNEKFNVDLNLGLNSSEKGVSLAFRRMLDENLYWVMVYFRWVDNFEDMKNLVKITKIKAIDSLICYGRRMRVRNYLHGHGLGRHSRDEIYSIAKEDIRAVSNYLESKPFMMGDNPTLVDATVFAYMAIFLWFDKTSPMNSMLRDEFKNIEPYCLRMKEQFWQDWDKVVPEGWKKSWNKLRRQWILSIVDILFSRHPFPPGTFSGTDWFHIKSS